MIQATGPFSEAYGAAPSAYLPDVHYFHPPGLGQFWEGPYWIGGALGGAVGSLVAAWPPNARKVMMYTVVGAIGAEAWQRYVPVPLPNPVIGALIAIGVSFIA